MNKTSRLIRFRGGGGANLSKDRHLVDKAVHCCFSKRFKPNPETRREGGPTEERAEERRREKEDLPGLPLNWKRRNRERVGRTGNKEMVDIQVKVLNMRSLLLCRRADRAELHPNCLTTLKARAAYDGSYVKPI